MRCFDGVWRLRGGFGADMPCASDPLGGGQGGRACGRQAVDPYLALAREGLTTSTMWRFITRWFWFSIALIFVVEAWLWDRLEVVVERIVAFIPLQAAKQWLGNQIEGLSPPATLIVFAVPAAMLFPLKLLAI